MLNVLPSFFILLPFLLINLFGWAAKIYDFYSFMYDYFFLNVHYFADNLLLAKFLFIFITNRKAVLSKNYLQWLLATILILNSYFRCWTGCSTWYAIWWSTYEFSRDDESNVPKVSLKQFVKSENLHYVPF